MTDDAREFWKVAATFPSDKEAVYPEHAAAHEFDEQAKRAERGGGRVLEYGCGGGSDAVSLYKRGAQVTFCDIVATNVVATNDRLGSISAKQFRAGLRRDISRLPTDAECEAAATAPIMHEWLGVKLPDSVPLPFENDTFDSVNCHGVLHHIPLPTMHEVIAEFFRVLKRGGHLYAMLYTEHLWARRFVATSVPLTDAAWASDSWPLWPATQTKFLPRQEAFGGFTDGGSIARAYTVESGTEVFTRAGFEVVKTTLYNNDDFRVFKCLKPL